MLEWLLIIGCSAYMFPFLEMAYAFIFHGFINPIPIHYMLFVIVTLTSNLGLFLSLNIFFNKVETRRKVGRTVLIFLVFWILPIAKYGVVAYGAFDLNDATFSLQRSARNSLPTMIQVLYKTTPHESQLLSETLYNIYGLELPYKSENQTLVPFVPSLDDIKERGKNVELDNLYIKAEKTEEFLFHECSLLLAVHLLCFVTVFTFGVLYLIFKAPKESKSDESALAT